MQPVVHLAVGYLCYAGYARWREGTPPGERATLAALFGAVLPDLLDKPPWMLGLAVGRTIGHSLLFAVPVVVGGWLLARSRERPTLGIAFAIGVGSHLATDVPWHVIAGDYDELGFLLWPITPMPPYSGTKPLATLGPIEMTTLWLEAAILVAGAGLWWADSRPGLAAIRNDRED